MQPLLPSSPFPGTRAVELTPALSPLLQAFFEANPAYFLATSGAPAGPSEGLEEITSQLPPGTPFTRKLVVGYACTDGELLAMVNVITDLMAKSICHVGTFILATSHHGTGKAQMLNNSIEQWAIATGAAWMRLGVVRGNLRAERFWSSLGYVPVRERPGIKMGTRIVTVRNMIKPLKGGSLEEYFAMAPRDRP